MAKAAKNRAVQRVFGANLTSFGLGVASAVAIGAAAPALAKSLRPAGKKLIKFGLRVGEELGRRAALSKEHLEDLVAEARAEYEAERAAEEEQMLQAGTEPGTGTAEP